MPWTESHTVLIRHRKLVELATALRIRPAHAIGHLHALWHAALEQQEDGDLSAWSDEFIAQASDYPGDAPQYVRLLQKYRWLDGRIIHDWLDYAGRYLDSKYRTRNPKRLDEIRSRHDGKPKAKPRSDSGQTPDIPPDRTNLTNQPSESEGAREERKSVRRLHGIPSTVEEVIAHGKTVSVDESRCREFWAHYEGQARTNPDGAVFWVTSGDAVVTKWKEKLPAFGHKKHGSNRNDNRPGVDRNRGTRNEAMVGQYDGVGKVS